MTGAITGTEAIAENDWRRQNPRFQSDNAAQNKALVAALGELAHARDCTPAQLALAWLLHQGGDIVPIPGTRRISRLDENAGAAIIALTEDEIDGIGAVLASHDVAGTCYPATSMGSLAGWTRIARLHSCIVSTTQECPVRRILKPVLALLALALLAWVYFAPQLTIQAMRRAAERGDTEALASRVDFPAVRASIKAQLADAVETRIGERMDAHPTLGAFRDFGVGLANAMAGPAVDAMVSPQAIALIFTGRGLARGGLAAATARDTDGEPIDGGIALPHWDATMGYEDLNTFSVRLRPDDDVLPPSTLIFKRHNLLWWKLSAIILSNADTSRIEPSAEDIVRQSR